MKTSKTPELRFCIFTCTSCVKECILKNADKGLKQKETPILCSQLTTTPSIQGLKDLQTVKAKIFTMDKDFSPSFPCQITPENSVTKAKDFLQTRILHQI